MFFPNNTGSPPHPQAFQLCLQPTTKSLGGHKTCREHVLFFLLSLFSSLFLAVTSVTHIVLSAKNLGFDKQKDVQVMCSHCGI